MVSLLIRALTGKIVSYMLDLLASCKTAVAGKVLVELCNETLLPWKALVKFLLCLNWPGLPCLAFG